MPPFPASLKPVHPYLQKAEEMKNADPVVSYYCNYWAVQNAITLGVKDPEANVFLASLLDSLEKAKTTIENQEAIKDDFVGKAYMENFAGNIFTKADDEERAKKATRTTATKFLAASQFMEVLRCFGDLDKETADKIKYSKFQAARILKALKAGENPNAESPAEDSALPPVLPYVSPTVTSPPILPPPAVDGGFAPGVQPMDRGPSAHSQHSTSSIAPIVPYRQSSDNPPQSPPPPQNEVRAPTSFTPPSSSFSPSQSPYQASHPAPPTPPPPPPPPRPQQSSPPFTYPPLVTHTHSSPPSNTIPQFPPQQPPPQFQYPGVSQPQAPSNYYSSPPEQRLPPSVGPSAAAPPSNYYVSQASAPPQAQPSPSYFPPQPQVVIDDEAIAKAQKHARWAISALNYEDVETAVKELRNALSTLGVR